MATESGKTRKMVLTRKLFQPIDSSYQHPEYAYDEAQKWITDNVAPGNFVQLGPRSRVWDRSAGWIVSGELVAIYWKEQEVGSDDAMYEDTSPLQ